MNEDAPCNYQGIVADLINNLRIFSVHAQGDI